MAASSAAVRVEGYKELVQAFKKMEGELPKELNDALRDAGEKPRSLAERLAGSEIRNISGGWERMRLGVTSRGVYIAPATRRRGGSPRPNLAVELMKEAMWPAVESTQEQTVRRLERMIDQLGSANGF